MLVLFTPWVPRVGFVDDLAAITAEDCKPTDEEQAHLYCLHNPIRSFLPGDHP